MPSLGNDLASIRKQLNLNIEDIHHSIKIPVAILESIEDDSIFTTLDENTTYIRSYVRSYAKALKINDAEIVRALDQTEIGIYSGFLNPSEENETESVPPGPDSSSATEKPEKDTSEKEDAGEKMALVPPPDQALQNDEPAGLDESDENEEQTENQYISPPPNIRSVDWADMGRKFTPLQTKSRIWMGLVLVILAIIIAAFLIIYQNYYQDYDFGSEATSNTVPAEVETPAADSLQLDLVAPAGTSASQFRTSEITPPEVLSDTLTMVIYAAYGILEPVRVFSDVIDGLNPYWIEEGEAFRFNFVNEIRIRGQYSRMVLLLNGHIIENFRQRFYNPGTEMVEINRSIFENDPVWLQPPPKSLGINAPPPTIVRDRPTFNYD